ADAEDRGPVDLVDDVDVERVVDPAVADGERNAGRAQHVRLERAPRREHEEGDRRADGEERRVRPDARPPESTAPGRRAPQAAERIVADEPGRPVELGHDLVAGVDAGGAADAVELVAVADVDRGRADHDAALAVHAIAGPARALLAARLAAGR